MVLRKNAKGFTLVELAIVLTVVSLIIGGIWLGASTVMRNNKAQVFAKQVVQVLQNAKTAYATQSGSGLAKGYDDKTGNTIAMKAGWFPDDMISGGYLITPFVDGSTKAHRISVISAKDTNGNNDSALSFSFGTAAGDMPTSACGQVASQLNSTTNLAALGVSAINGVATSKAAPAATSAVQNACDGTKLSVIINIP